MTDLDLVTIKDRQVPITKLTETQMMLLVREAQVLRSGRHDQDRRLRGIAFMIDIVESALTDPEDQEWLMNLAGTGKISFAEILEIVTPLEEQAKAAKATPVRRGRAAIKR